MRLPSALLGTACIPLVFWLGMLTRQQAAGWIAAALVAVNGHLVFWSQIARMFTLACCLGLLATILLLKIAQQSHASRDSEISLCSHHAAGTLHPHFLLADSGGAYLLDAGQRMESKSYRCPARPGFSFSS